MNGITLLDEQLDRLANFEPSPFPVISLYINAQENQNGRTSFEPFVRKELPMRAKTFPERSEERQSYEKDMERINSWLKTELRPESSGVAIFACSGENDFFEAIQLEAPIQENQLFVHNQPHLYTLAMLNDQFPRYAAVVADTHQARIFVFGLRHTLGNATVENEKQRRSQKGGWSQARYQRHIDEQRDQHVKEFVDQLERIAREENIRHILFAGDDVVIPMIRENLPKPLLEKVVDVLKIDITAPEHEIVATTLEAMRRQNEEGDKEIVKRLFDEYRSGGLGVLGVRQTLAALRNGQVDELVVTGRLEKIEPDHEKAVRDLLDTELAGLTGGVDGDADLHSVLADALVTRARQTGAKVTFIEDSALLEQVGGVGAILRYRHAEVII